MKNIIAILLFALLLQACRRQVFGAGCGEAGAYYPPYAKRAAAMVKQKNYKALTNWLTSKNPVERAFAVQGFHRLKENGYTIPGLTLIRIKGVKEDTTSIETCIGCLYGSQSLREALSTYEFDFKPITTYVYGMGGCGYAGTKRRERVYMEKMVADNDTAALSNWLFSEYKELNAYAVEGYATLKDKGFEMAPVLMDRIRVLQHDSTKINTCGGCIFESEPLNRIVLGWGFYNE